MKFISHVFAMILIGLVAFDTAAAEPIADVPEPFRKSEPDSKFTISYDDIDRFLKAMVVDVGRSTREKASARQAETGTRMKVSVRRSTVNEGNRFYFEEIKGNEDFEGALHALRSNLEGIPSQVPLEYFSRDEQLAYWLNLYNITLLDELVEVYPKRSLKRVVTGRKSILAKKLLEVSGIPLSLDDIQYTILAQNYDHNPLVLYGLYQGIIGGPDIRKAAYKGRTVYQSLVDNAEDFINSNRGTYAKDEYTFRVSNWYERNAVFFPDFETDLKEHLLKYLEAPEKSDLRSASRITTDIDDWTVTDVYGTADIGGSFASNKAALIDAVRGSQFNEEGAAYATGFSNVSGGVLAKAPSSNRFSPDTLEFMRGLKAKEDATNMDKARVTVEELGEAPPEGGEGKTDDEETPD